MHEKFAEIPDLSARQNLKWLLILRWFVISAVYLMVSVSIYVVGLPLPRDPLWTLISITIVVNSLTWFRIHSFRPIREVELFFHLVLDVLAITALLYYTGGGTNPLSWFFLLPLIITATILPQIYTWLMVGLTSICYTVLIGYHVPLPELPSQIDNANIPQSILEMQSSYDLDLHVFALWFGYLLIAGIVAYFIVEMANTLRERERKLSEIREQALRDERVIALGTLAAGAAHEMGTPLGTIAILSHELQQQYNTEEYGDLGDKMKILREQSDRCKNALSILSASAGELRADSGHIMPVGKYLQEVVEQWQGQQPNTHLEYHVEGTRPEPNILAERTLTHALINILNNAGDVSPQLVILKSKWNASKLKLEIRDHGPGISPEVAANIGKTPMSTKKKGLGVGLFLASTTISRMGGSLKLINIESGGACTQIELPVVPPTDSSANEIRYDKKQAAAE